MFTAICGVIPRVVLYTNIVQQGTSAYRLAFAASEGVAISVLDSVFAYTLRMKRRHTETNYYTNIPSFFLFPLSSWHWFSHPKVNRQCSYLHITIENSNQFQQNAITFHFTDSVLVISLTVSSQCRGGREASDFNLYETGNATE
jgi:hypothetical protein